MKQAGSWLADAVAAAGSLINGLTKGSLNESRRVGGGALKVEVERAK